MQKLIDVFTDALIRGSFLQGLITAGLLVFYAVLILTSKPVPQELTGWVALVLGFWFGSKVQSAIITQQAKKE